MLGDEACIGLLQYLNLCFSRPQKRIDGHVVAKPVAYVQNLFCAVYAFDAVHERVASGAGQIEVDEQSLLPG